MEERGRKPYDTPRLEAWGDVRELTQTGRTKPGCDAKQGCVMANGQ